MNNEKLIADICNHYKENGYQHIHLELQMYSIDDVKHLVSGYVPKIIGPDGKVYRLWCKSGIKKTEVCLEDLIKPYEGPCPHQYWMKEGTRNKIVDKLENNKVLEKSYANFEELYDELVRLKITRGDLFRYDLALRIGKCLDTLPKDYVYLHRGALEGAQVLQTKGLVTLPASWKYRVEKSVFAKLFPDMEAFDIENLLCIHKEDFKK